MKVQFKRKIYLLLIVLATVLVAIVLFTALLLHRPSFYKPLDYAGSKEVSLYLTHELLPALYNGAQLQEPFDLVVAQSGINDIVARFDWPQELNGVRFSAPMVFFVPAQIVLMGMVSLDGVEFVVTVMAEPKLDADGLLNLQVESVKIGAVDITPIAAVLARKIYRQQSADADDFWVRATGSLVNDEPFEPVFKVEDKKVRVDKITLERRKLTIHFIPVFE